MQKRIFKIVFIFFISAGVIVSLFSIASTYYERRIMTRTIEDAVWLSDGSWPKNLSDCDKEDSACFQSLVSFGLSDETLCKNIVLPNMKNRCFAYAARNTQNPAICEKIAGPERVNGNDMMASIKQYCIAVATNKPADCVFQIPDASKEEIESLKNFCTAMSKVSPAIKDPIACALGNYKERKESESKYWKYQCLTDLAQLNKNPALCDVLDDYHRVECYVDVAYILNDKSVCDSLPNEPIEGNSYTWQSRCKIEFQNLKNSNFPNWIQNTNH